MSSCAYSENEHKNVVISSMHGLPHLSLQHFSFALECNEYNLWTEGGELESFWEQIKTAIREVAPTSPMRRWIDSTELACSQYFCLPTLKKAERLTLYLFKKQKWEQLYNCHLHIDNASKINFNQLKNFTFCCEHENPDQESENVICRFLSMICESASEADHLKDLKIQLPVSSQNFGLWPIRSDWMKKILERIHTFHLWNVQLLEDLIFLKTNILQELSLNGCAPLLSDQIEALVITQSKSLARLKVLNLHSLIANLVSRVCEALDRARPELLPSSKVGKEWPILKLCVDFEEQHMHAWLERISRWKYIDGSNAICTNLKRLCYEIRKSRD